MSAGEMHRTLERLAQEIVERQGGTRDLALVGIERRGPQLAARIAEAIHAIDGTDVPVSALDVTPWRDDREGLLDPDAATAIPTPGRRPWDPSRTTIVLVDDVLYTGRTVRAALDALVHLGRPARVRLAVLVDRGHRELPIQADHVGRLVPTGRDDVVETHLGGMDGGEDEVIVRPRRQGRREQEHRG
jgi:pyrimidine operon attenuation protein/uracil phosphoribosyltransferase